ncbi:hypothetical protein H0H87_007395 [Tephrocybe sp. NHM501043]|nr:hypothetical protein H0H87_007395 [Tephrocybe sp. NHM501043]
MKTENPYTKRASTGSKCCGVVEEAANRTLQRRAARSTPQPWIVRKLMVGVTFSAMAYSAYVFIGRLCVDMIRRLDGAGGSRGTGAQVVFTPPGYAKDVYLSTSITKQQTNLTVQHVSQTDRPPYPEPPPFVPYDYVVENARHPARPSHSQGPSRDLDQESIGGPSYENLPIRQPISPPKPAVDSRTSITHVERKDSISNTNIPRKPELAYVREKEPADYLHRRPQNAPILRPEHRYCDIDGIVKPYRTHHCRNCGTVCIFFASEVDATADEFFLNFVQAASVFTTYTLVTLLIFVVRDASSTDGDIDPQKIVIVALSGLFALFTIVLQVTHVRLIWLGQTTLENMQGADMKRRERHAMNDVIGTCALR